MKRRPRRPVLDINGEESDSSRGRWQNKYQQIAVDHPEQNGTPNNPLASLLGEYNSDSDGDDTKPEKRKLDDKVNDFLKEIQMIAPEKQTTTTEIKTSETMPGSQHRSRDIPNCQWQECFDESTGYPYYWHTETNEVTWEMPAELKILRGTNNESNHTNPQANHWQLSHAQWPNFLPNKYPQLQTNIPEGMIPKEVVARNRNRQVGIRKSREEPIKPAIETKSRIGSKEDDSDNEKIEMITSFGNEESESDESEDEIAPRGKSEKDVIEKSISKSQKNLDHNVDKATKDVSNVTIGPLLPPGIVPMIHGPENVVPDVSHEEDASNTKERSTHRDSSRSSSPKENSPSEDVEEKDILQRPKSQARVLQRLGGQVSESVESVLNGNASTDDIISQIEKETPVDHRSVDVGDSIDETRTVNADRKSAIEESAKSAQKALKISLVAGYSDDSDLEEETSPKKTNIQPLFPISEYSTATESSVPNPGNDSNSNIKHNERENFSNDTDQIDPSVQTIEETQDNSEGDDAKESRLAPDPPKPNKFLENLEMPAKGFQRKKRIAFDVAPTKRPQETQGKATNRSDLLSSNYAATSFSETERHGFGFAKEAGDADNDDDNLDKHDARKSKVETSQSLKSISFVKGETATLKNDETTKGEDKPDEPENQNLKELSGIVVEKLKFLSEGSPVVSAIQIMAIQLQTLIGAWDSGDLKGKYFSHWLENTGHELARLERAAAPSGWDCFWDRSHKRYYYRKVATGEVQWNYPETDVAGGTEEMDLCTTPPPPDDEEPVIIEQPVIATEKPKSDPPLEVAAQVKSTVKIDDLELNKIKEEPKVLEPPPPPHISSPSPPPPPRIFAEDLKKGKKRRINSNDQIPNVKKKIADDVTTLPDTTERVNPPLPPSPPKSSQPPLPPNPPATPKPPSSEPLPPGVDPPDVPYTLPVTAIEQNLVYARATRQTNPIYAATIGDRALTVPIMDHHAALIQGQLMHYPTYQHLHNQAIIAAATGLASQEAVQFMMTDYAQAYGNTQVIAKPPVKCQNESLGSVLDSFYNDIASIERTNVEPEPVEAEIPQKEPTPPPVVAAPVVPRNLIETEPPSTTVDPVGREKRRKKAKVGIGKKQKEMSSMVAKWQKAQQAFEDSD